MDLREELVRLMRLPEANKSELARRFGVSRSNGWKWDRRFELEGVAGLADRSRRPKSSPSQTSADVEAMVLLVREASNEAWGGRKIARFLESERWLEKSPSPSTITEILRRHGRLDPPDRASSGPYLRFERAEPNLLWQMDFKGHFPLFRGRCHPLTVLDDRSRYNLELGACGDETAETVRTRLEAVFRRYGLPLQMLMDNGSPWGDAADQPHTHFTVWLMQLGVQVIHGRPYHPQTQGKEERFHRTLQAEVLRGRSFQGLADCQRAFDDWRGRYNHHRPHEALGMNVPASVYRPSQISFPEQLPPIEYGPGDLVRRADVSGFISFQGRQWRIGKPFKKQPLGLRPTKVDGCYEVRFCAHVIGRIDLNQPGHGMTCGFVDDAGASPTTPQAPQQQQEAI